MSIIFGLLKEQGAKILREEVQRLAFPTRRYATGTGAVFQNGRLGLGFQPYVSHERSKFDVGLVVSPECSFCFDGRLDNHSDLSKAVELDPDASDSMIVRSAFLLWGERCFERLIGDWALSLWSEMEHALYLARDHAGSRTLYYRAFNDRFIWSTYLDTFFYLGADETGHSESYAARYLAGVPIGNLTPYLGIYSVKPAYYLKIQGRRASEHAHWNPLSLREMRYGNDQEYECHFLHLLSQAVERRTGPGEPILAQLSGGMDSTSIVCVSDHLRRRANPDAEILDTVSFYDDSDPSLNEKAYFSITEAKRGKSGTHIEVASSERSFEPFDFRSFPYFIPGADSVTPDREGRFYDLVWSKGYRSVLSGIGGDEILGGIPSALPELADYLKSGHLLQLARRSFAWSVVDRSPIIVTLKETLKYTIGLYGFGGSRSRRVPPWISGGLRKHLPEMDTVPVPFLARLGATPHSLENQNTWWAVMETLPHLTPQALFRPEYRYPLLDKDLVEYMFGIPREQVLRPGRRRSLMRRALRDIVPAEILDRPRKAFQARAPLHALRQAHAKLERLFADAIVVRSEFVVPDRLRSEFDRAEQGESEWVQALLRTIALELWLRSCRCGEENLPAGDEALRVRLTA